MCIIYIIIRPYWQSVVLETDDFSQIILYKQTGQTIKSHYLHLLVSPAATLQPKPRDKISEYFFFETNKLFSLPQMSLKSNS